MKTGRQTSTQTAASPSFPSTFVWLLFDLKYKADWRAFPQSKFITLYETKKLRLENPKARLILKNEADFNEAKTQTTGHALLAAICR